MPRSALLKLKTMTGEVLVEGIRLTINQTANFNQMLEISTVQETVTVTGVDDDADDGDQAYTIETVAATSARIHAAMSELTIRPDELEVRDSEAIARVFGVMALRSCSGVSLNSVWSVVSRNTGFALASFTISG